MITNVNPSGKSFLSLVVMTGNLNFFYSIKNMGVDNTRQFQGIRYFFCWANKSAENISRKLGNSIIS